MSGQQRLNQIRQLNDRAACVLVGPSRPELLDNIQAAHNTSFSPDELSLIQSILPA